MKVENIGEIFFEGKIINLDNSSIEELNQILQNIKNEKDKVIDSINDLLEEVQS